MKRVHLSFDLNYFEMSITYVSRGICYDYLLYYILRLQFTEKKIKERRRYSVLLKPILAHLFIWRFNKVQMVLYIANVYFRSVKGTKMEGYRDEASIMCSLKDLRGKQGGDRYICRRRGSVSSTIPCPSCIAVYGAVMHIMGGMCTCRGSQLFDTAVGRFAIYAAAISHTHRA